MDKNLNIINPEDKDYYDGKLYMVGLYPGAGAELKTFYVYGEYEGEALESVVAYLDLSSETGLLLDMDEVEDIVYDDYGEEYNNWLLEHPESDWFEFANEYLGYIYVDATMKGASQPYYVEGNYLRIEEVENKVEEDKEVITEVNQYQELKDKHQKEFNEFPIGFAFSDEQFKEQMEKLGLTANDEDKIVGIGAGGFIRKDDVDKFNEMNKRQRAEEEEAIKNDTTGEGYIKDMFDYELANHEYGYTYDLTDTLASLGLSMEDINKDKRLQNGLNLALKRYDESKEIKTEDFKPATVEENPEIKNPHFWWEDKDTFIMEFDGGVDNEGDKYWYLVEYWADEDTYHFFKQYDYDTIVLNLPEDKKEQIINMMKAKMN